MDASACFRHMAGRDIRASRRGARSRRCPERIRPATEHVIGACASNTILHDYSRYRKDGKSARAITLIIPSHHCTTEEENDDPEGNGGWRSSHRCRAGAGAVEQGKIAAQCMSTPRMSRTISGRYELFRPGMNEAVFTVRLRREIGLSWSKSNLSTLGLAVPRRSNFGPAGGVGKERSFAI